MTFTPQSLLTSLSEINPDSIWYVGFSGGLDSTVLLHALCALQLPIVIKALHVNHQITPYADAWQAQCNQLCESLQISFIAEKVVVNNTGRGIEDAARNARYAVFERHVSTNILLTAHHADDQAETLLLRLMRGAGPRGLAAMAQTRPLGAGLLHRPLLQVSRRELELYAQVHQLTWVNDESNSDTHYDRNFLRAEVMPLLQERWPHFTSKWQQTAELCADNELLLEEIAAQDITTLDLRTERLGSSVSMTTLLTLSKVRQQNVIRYWLRSSGFTIPEQQHWQQLYRQLTSTRSDHEMDIRWGNVSLRVYQQRLYALPLSFFNATVDVVPTTFLLSAANAPVPLSRGCLAIELARTDAGVHRIKPLSANLHIAYRHGGERCKPAGRHHSQTLKRLLQEYELEPWLRDKIPLIYCNDELVAVGDLWVCADYVAATTEEGFVFTWLL